MIIPVVGECDDSWLNDIAGGHVHAKHVHQAIETMVSKPWSLEPLAGCDWRPFARELWVEHRTAEPLPDLPGLRHRRYGDTTITILTAEDVRGQP